MPTGTWQTAASADDYSNTQAGNGGHFLNSQHLRVWNDTTGSTTGIWGTLLRFVVSGANAPTRGASLTAFLGFTSVTAGTADDLRADVYYLTNPPTAFATNDNPWTTYTRSTTKVSVSLDNVTATDGSYGEVEITTLIKEIIDSSTWDVGDTIGLALLGTNGSNNRLSFVSFDETDSAFSPRLRIVWTAPTDAPIIANAGSDQTAQAGQQVQVTGTATDADNTITSGSWQFLTRPTGSTATLTPSTAVFTNDRATFVPDLAGTYTLRFTATNNIGLTAYDDLTVTATAPAAVTGGAWVRLALTATAPVGAVSARIRLTRAASANGEAAMVRRVAFTLGDPGMFTPPLSTTNDVVELQVADTPADLTAAGETPPDGAFVAVTGSPGDLTGITSTFTDPEPAANRAKSYRARLVDPNEGDPMTSPWSTTARVAN